MGKQEEAQSVAATSLHCYFLAATAAAAARSPSKPKAHAPEVCLSFFLSHHRLTRQPAEWAHRVVEDYKRNKFPNDLFSVRAKSNQPPGAPAEMAHPVSRLVSHGQPDC